MRKLMKITSNERTNNFLITILIDIQFPSSGFLLETKINLVMF